MIELQIMYETAHISSDLPHLISSSLCDSERMVDMLTQHNCTWYYCYGYAPRFVQWITTTKMCMLAKVFRTLLVYMVLNKYHWCLWKGILFLIYKCNCVQYLWWLFKSRVTMSTMLEIPILQLKTQKQKNHTKRCEKKPKRPNNSMSKNRNYHSSNKHK